MRSIYIMATPVEDGPSLIGNASDVCAHLWGTIPSGYPKHIAKVLAVAKEGGAYKGYIFQTLGLNYRPILLPNKTTWKKAECKGTAQDIEDVLEAFDRAKAS